MKHPRFDNLPDDLDGVITIPPLDFSPRPNLDKLTARELLQNGYTRMAYRKACPYNSVSLLADGIYKEGVRKQLSAVWSPVWE